MNSVDAEKLLNDMFDNFEEKINALERFNDICSEDYQNFKVVASKIANIIEIKQMSLENPGFTLIKLFVALFAANESSDMSEDDRNKSIVEVMRGIAGLKDLVIMLEKQLRE